MSELSTDKGTMPYKTLCRRISAVASAGGVLALALTPASSNAAVIPFGSDLAAPANLVEARQADTAYWQTTFADGRSPVVQADGQIRSVQIKGIALASPVEGEPGGETMFHVQVMGAARRRHVSDPQSGRHERGLLPATALGRPSGDHDLSAGEPLCEGRRRGLFNTVGGWDGIVNQSRSYPGGTPLQIFSRMPGAVASQFESADMTTTATPSRRSRCRATSCS